MKIQSRTIYWSSLGAFIDVPSRHTFGRKTCGVPYCNNLAYTYSVLETFDKSYYPSAPNSPSTRRHPRRLCYRRSAVSSSSVGSLEEPHTPDSASESSPFSFSAHPSAMPIKKSTLNSLKIATRFIGSLQKHSTKSRAERAAEAAVLATFNANSEEDHHL